MEIMSDNNKGQSLLEVILAMAIFAAIAGVLISMSVGGFRGLEQGGEQTEAEALAQEGIEAVKSIRDRAWNENTFADGITQRILPSAGQWAWNGAGSDTGLGTNGKFARTITFNNVCRDNTSQNIVNCGTCGATCYTDVHGKRATVSVTWTTRGGISNTVQKVAYVTNWDSRDQFQNVTLDFTSGAPAPIFTSTQENAGVTGGDGNGAVTLSPQ
jgi:type II secretory pathway pseudopilin PulG